MNWTVRRLSVRCATLLGSASLLTLSQTLPGHAQGQVAQAEEIPETVLITGSLIRGTAAVGVPVVNLTPRDFAETGALTTADLFRTFPAAMVSPGPIATQSGGNIERATRVNLRGLDSGDATRSLLMVDGLRFPAQGNGMCLIDPSIVPALALDHVDILVDGASATYGSDAIGGVINLILKRNMDGATTQVRWTTAQGGKNRYLASAIWGRTWDGGQVTLTYEWYDDSPISGRAFSKQTLDFTPWGLDDRRQIGSSVPPTISVGNPARPAAGPIGTSAQIGHGCTNCYAVPLGTGQNWDPGSTGFGPPAKPIGQPDANPFGLNLLDWANFATAANGGTNGVRNQINPYVLAWYDAAQQRNAAVITVDQRLTSNISFFGSGFYSNRRATYWNPANQSPIATNLLQNIAVPTFNPYYPVHGAPNNLRVNYNISVESPGVTHAYELADRYQLGLNIALPAGWASQLYHAHTYDSSFNWVTGAVNKSAVSAALGWTIGTVQASGTTPAIATWTKPSSVPYLNLFCDPTQYQCNSPVTLDYIEAVRSYNQKMHIIENGWKADGPLFDLPGGTVKAAVGATLTTFRFSVVNLLNTNTPTLLVPYQVDGAGRQVWATFAQLNVPVFGEQNGFLGMRRLELEFSWRHDQYSDVKGTSNPKVAFNWAPFDDLLIRGAWGNSFRAPVFGELSPLANVNTAGWNLGSLAQTTSPILAGCKAGGPLPPEGSGAWKLMSSAGDGTIGSTTVCDASLIAAPGISVNGGSGGAAPVRAGGGWDGGWSGLRPELATNWGIGFDYTPSANFLTGLNIQATYYIIKISNRITSFGNPTSSTYNDPQLGSFAFLVPTDFANNPSLPGAAACTSNLLPTTCQPFQEAVRGLLASPRAQVSPLSQTLMYWINDGGAFNKGWTKLEGVDWNVSYDWEWGNLGAFNVGLTGTYYLHNYQEVVPGAAGSEVVDWFHSTFNQGELTESNGVATQPRMVYRARVGWSNGSWSFSAFMDYTSHFFHSQSPPPNVNGNFCTSSGGFDASGGGGTYPCAIDNYTNLLPSYYTFDLSLGYNTMDLPANEYLRNISVQLVVQNVMDRQAPFGYRISTGGGNPCACDITKTLMGRTISLILTKEW